MDHLKDVRKWMIVIFSILVFTFLFASGTGYFSYQLYLRENVQNIQIIQKPLREEMLYETKINDFVKSKIRRGEEEEIYKFYDRYTKNREITYLIISSSLTYNIPINYLFSLIKRESGFNVNAINTVNGKGNYDLGLMQLNEKTFKAYKAEYLMHVENNIRFGCEHLIQKYNIYGTWYEALLTYNSGNTELVKNASVNHLVSILTNATNLDIDFNREF